MGDILSQNEIDDLLKALNTGELDVQQMQTTTSEQKIRIHDFSRPNKFAKDHLRTLSIINDNYARLVTNYLTGYLRTLVQIDIVTVEELTYFDFSQSIEKPAIMAIVDLIPMNGSIIFEVAPNIAYAFVDRILGGKGNSIEKIREFTEIEKAILERIIIQMLNIMREPWENVVQLRPRFDRMETNAQFVQIVAPNEMVALITLNARVGDVEGMINICIPHMVIEPIMPKLSTRLWFSTVEKETSHESKEVLEAKIGSTKVPIVALLGKTTITVSDFIELQPGDVIPLETLVNADLEVIVGNLHKFNAKPGVKKNKVAVKISEIVNREDD